MDGDNILALSSEIVSIIISIDPEVGWFAVFEGEGAIDQPQ